MEGVKKLPQNQELKGSPFSSPKPQGVFLVVIPHGISRGAYKVSISPLYFCISMSILSFIFDFFSVEDFHGTFLVMESYFQYFQSAHGLIMQLLIESLDTLTSLSLSLSLSISILASNNRCLSLSHVMFSEVAKHHLSFEPISWFLLDRITLLLGLAGSRNLHCS
ncbi:hypothetical protein L6452_37200 [Arctium lappa]|uniref:Uncharacterized protein n=1 Tax=Arctium lappa TaxID=4217 RepID=A0ACB8Y305_ARCLA|nr:hypothetical protein L6452_37200 [Arctium lappa]